MDFRNAQVGKNEYIVILILLELFYKQSTYSR